MGPAISPSSEPLVIDLGDGTRCSGRPSWGAWGGANSHAAIVAREYGLPAVMGTADGTKKLRDGQRVRVDGTAGRVYPSP